MSAAGADALRVVFMGTSLTARYDWPLRVAESVSACLDRPVQPEIVARPGETSSWGITTLDRLVDLQPDALVVEFTINDADLRRRVSVSESRANHVTIIEAARQANPDVEILLLTLNRGYGLRGLLRPRLQRYEAQYAALATELGTGALDLGDAWQAARDGDGSEILPDGLHPTSGAARSVITGPLSDALVRQLGGACAPS